MFFDMGIFSFLVLHHLWFNEFAGDLSSATKFFDMRPYGALFWKIGSIQATEELEESTKYMFHALQTLVVGCIPYRGTLCFCQLWGLPIDAERCMSRAEPFFCFIPVLPNVCYRLLSRGDKSASDLSIRRAIDYDAIVRPCNNRSSLGLIRHISVCSFNF